MAILTREEILSAEDLELVEIDVPEWGGEVAVAPMTVSQRIDFEEKHYTAEGMPKNIHDADLIYDMLSFSLKKKDGTQMFRRDEIQMLNGKNSKLIRKIFNECITINFFEKEVVAETKKK
jgi:hypothetical protein